MYQYYIIEIQKSHAGEYAHIVHWTFDADADIARQKGESKLHEIAMVAATSDTAMHSAILISAEGAPLRDECYHHKPKVEAE